MSNQSVGHMPADDERSGGRSDGFFVPWVTDANALLTDLDKASREKLRRLVLVQPTGVVDYEKSSVLFVAGDRGTGKSSVLLKKAVALLMAGDPKAYKTLRPNLPFVNELASGCIPVPLQQYRRLTSPTLWERYWRLVLIAHFASMALRHRNVTNVGDAKKILTEHFGLETSKGEVPDAASAYQFFHDVWSQSAGARETIGPSMKKLVTWGISEEEAEKWAEKAAGVLDSCTAVDSETRFTIFVDAIDEAVGSPLGTPLFHYLYAPSKAGNSGLAAGPVSLADAPLKEGASHDEYRELAHLMWRHSQTGFMLAADSLWSDYSQMMATYGAVRREAKEWYTDPASTSRTKQKVERNKVVGLNYTAAQLAEIFALNVRHTPETELFSPLDAKSVGSEANAMFGFDFVTHTRVYREAESLVSLMIRHTFMAPRQLVGIARRAKSLPIEPRLRQESVAEIMAAIDAESCDVFHDYVANVSPPWTSVLATLVLKLRSNVFTMDRVDTFEKDNDCAGFFGQLYSRRLAGIPVYDTHKGKVIQQFHLPNGTEQLLDKPSYLFLHPALSSYIFSELDSPDLQRSFYSCDFIVGEGMACPNSLVPSRVQIVYESDADEWMVRVDGTPIGVGRSGLASDDVDAEIAPVRAEHRRAAMMAIVLVAYAMRRTGKTEVTLEDLSAQCEEFEAAKIHSGRLCNYPLRQFAATHLTKESGYVKTSRDWLKAVGANILVRDRTCSLRWLPQEPSLQNSHFHWLEMSQQDICVLPVHKRRGFSSIGKGKGA
jgi:hypothetical protein